MIKFLRIYLPSAFVLMALCYSYYHLSSRYMLQHATMDDASLGSLELQLIQDEFQNYSSDLITFANMKEWDAVFSRNGATELQELAHEFKTLLATKKYYEKIRLLDLKGKELLRVGFHDGHVNVVPKDQLQDKRHRYYLAASATLRRNQIYISPLDLNWEHGQPERPLEPAIRLITPVFDTHGQKRGLLVFNILAENMLQRFMNKHAGFPGRSRLINRQGHWLHNGKMPKDWVFLLPDQQIRQFRDQFPHAWQRMQQHDQGQFINQQGLFSFVTIRPLQAAYRVLPSDLKQNFHDRKHEQQPVLRIIQYRSSDELAALTAPLAQRISGYAVIFLLLLVPLIWRMTHAASRREQAERELQRSEHEFRQLVEDLPDGVLVQDGETVIYANQAAIEMFCGKEPKSLLGTPIIDYVHPESRQVAKQRIQAMKNGGSLEPVEEHLLACDGSDRFVVVSAMNIEFEGRTAIQVVLHDVTDQRKLEGALRLSNQRHELYLTQTRLAVIEWHDDFTVATWNHGAEVIFGYTADEAIGKHAAELLLNEDQLPDVKVLWQQLLATEGGEHSINENVRRDGHIITCEWHNTPLRRKDGKVIGVTSLCRDISEQQRQQTELKKLRQAIESAGEAFMITDADTMIEYVNPAFSKMTGYAADEVIGKTPKMLNSGQQKDAFYHDFWKKITSGETWHGSLVDKRKDGSLYPALMSVAPILDGKGNITHYVSIQQDMSEHEELEAKFRQAQKMEALGTLVGGIAHDFNNVLAGILGNLYLLKKQMTSDAGVQTKLERIEKAGLRAADMIRQLLTFARKGESALTPMPVQPFIKEILKLARSSIPENITLLQDLGEEDYQIRGDGSQMQQMLLNLLVNASHALEGRDKPAITVSMKIYEPDEDFLIVNGEIESKPLLCITVADNGCGISKANLEHVFEPFFTTKQEGKGTGLGLAMVYGSIQNHGGVIAIESEEGEGTRMHLYFPLCESEKAAAKKETMDVICGKGETILLADDNEHVREIMQEILQDFGYRVLVAENGQQALMMFMDHLSEVGLALLDIVMPVMGGEEAAERLRELKADLPILFLSGYEKENFLTDKPAIQNIPVLKKPVDLAELSIQIHKELLK